MANACQPSQLLRLFSCSRKNSVHQKKQGSPDPGDAETTPLKTFTTWGRAESRRVKLRKLDSPTWIGELVSAMKSIQPMSPTDLAICRRWNGQPDATPPPEITMQ